MTMKIKHPSVDNPDAVWTVDVETDDGSGDCTDEACPDFGKPHRCESHVHPTDDVLANGYIVIDGCAVHYLCRDCLAYVVEERRLDGVWH